VNHVMKESFRVSLTRAENAASVVAGETSVVALVEVHAGDGGTELVFTVAGVEGCEYVGYCSDNLYLISVY